MFQSTTLGEHGTWSKHMAIISISHPLPHPSQCSSILGKIRPGKNQWQPPKHSLYTSATFIFIWTRRTRSNNHKDNFFFKSHYHLSIYRIRCYPPEPENHLVLVGVRIVKENIKVGAVRVARPAIKCGIGSDVLLIRPDKVIPWTIGRLQGCAQFVKLDYSTSEVGFPCGQNKRWICTGTDLKSHNWPCTWTHTTAIQHSKCCVIMTSCQNMPCSVFPGKGCNAVQQAKWETRIWCSHGLFTSSRSSDFASTVIALSSGSEFCQEVRCWTRKARIHIIQVSVVNDIDRSGQLTSGRLKTPGDPT